MQASAASQAASDASSFAMFASAPHFSPRSNLAAAVNRMRSAASTWAYALAIGNCIPWFVPIGFPKTTRFVAYFEARSTNQRPSPMDSAATRIRSAFHPSIMYRKPLPSSPIRLSTGISISSKNTVVVWWFTMISSG